MTDQPYYQRHVFICTNERDDGKECCGHKGSLDLLKYLKDRLKTLGLSGAGKIAATKSGCLGRCALGPSLVIYPDNIWVFPKTTAEIDEIIEKHLAVNK
jgi:(2Fe-2S) ferredoxin